MEQPNEMLFMRGNAMSGDPIISGTNQLPKPPIIAGITMKKIMIRPCAVVNTLKVCASWKICRPGYISSSRMPIDSVPADHPPTNAKKRYIVPMSCGWSNRHSAASRSDAHARHGRHGHGRRRGRCRRMSLPLSLSFDLVVCRRPWSRAGAAQRAFACAAAATVVGVPPSSRANSSSPPRPRR